MKWVDELYIYIISDQYKHEQPRLSSQFHYHNPNITFTTIHLSAT